MIRHFLVGKENEMNERKKETGTKRERLFAVLMSLLITLAYMPMAMIAGTSEVSAADSINVTLSKSSTMYTYGGSGLAHHYTATVNGKTRQAYCLQPNEVPPDTGSRKASAMPDSSKVSKTMYYCYGYLGQKKLSKWLSNNGYSSHASGMDFYLLCHVLLSYQYDSSTAFVGWSGGVANTKISESYQNMIKKTAAYVNSLDDPAGFDSSISFASTDGSAASASWNSDGEFKSDVIKLKGHEDNYVEYKVPSGMSLVMEGKTYGAGETVEIDGGQSFYLKTSDFERANTTYSSGTLTGNLQDYTAYKITDSGSQNMAFFAVDKADTASFTVKFGKVDIKLGTKAQDNKTLCSQGTTYADSAFTDTVSYENITPGKAYTVKGTLIDKSTGKPITVNGNAVTAEKTFTPDKAAGTVDVDFAFDASLLKGKTTVVFEDLYCGSLELASHADINDEGQMLYYPEVKTTANDIKTEEHQGITAKDTVVVDNVTYSNLIPGKEYTVKGKLVDKDTGNPITVDGKEITSEKTFKAETASGSIKLKFIFDATGLKGKTTVVFENLYLGDVDVTSHADITDEGQSVHYPEIRTTAKDAKTGDNEGMISKETTIVDTVSYSNLLPGKTYTVKGVLMDKETKKPLMVNGNKVTAEQTFTAESASGSVDMTFTFDATGMEGKTTVVFEKLVFEGVNVTLHADIDDEGQSVHYPDVHTSAKDGATGTHMGKLEKTATIIDTVAYKNLVPGKEYTVKGILMNKETGKALVIDGKEVTAEKTFTPDKADGTVEVKFAFDSRGLEGKTLVVFEDLYHNDIKVTAHADIKDNAQTVSYPKPVIHKTVTDNGSYPQTGDNSKMWIFILIALAAGGTLIMALKKKSAEEIAEEMEEKDKK